MSASKAGSSSQSVDQVCASASETLIPESGSPTPIASPILANVNKVDGHGDEDENHDGDDDHGDDDHREDDSAPSDLKLKLRSAIWSHYDRVNINGNLKAVCKYCGVKLVGSTGNGTSHLRAHYKRKHKKNDNMRQQVLTNNFNKGCAGVPDLTMYSFDHTAARKELASAIIMHEWPLSIVDQVGFKRYSNALQPLFKVSCRNTIKSDILKIYEYEKGKTMTMVATNASRLAITTDMWTSSNQKKGFMAITAHFIDATWTLQSRILRFIYVPCPHTKDVLCEQLFNCLMDWNIDRKISCITVDNCSTNDAMVGLLWEKLDFQSLMLGGDLFHMRCCAHILNLIVKDGLDVIKVGIEKMRDSVAYWTASPKRDEKFEETARQLKVTCTKKLGLDCATRWNSTFLMLQTALQYKEVFYRLSKRDAQYRSLPDEHEWEFAKEVCEKLKVFYKVTELFSGTKYPTTNQCFPNICEIRLALRSWHNEGYGVIKEMAAKMIEKFDKYWSVIHGVVGVSAVLDPRYKIKVMEFYFDKLFGENYREEVDKIRDLCYKLLREYRRLTPTEGIGDTSVQPESIDESLTEYDLFIQRSSKRNRVDYGKEELDHYLSQEVLPKTPGLDVLNWWKMHEAKYPILSSMARDMLAIPVSTVASESAFSISGRLVSPHRSRLHADTIEALMCAQSWLWAAEMKGESSIGYATIHDDSDGSDITNV